MQYKAIVSEKFDMINHTKDPFYSKDPHRDLRGLEIPGCVHFDACYIMPI
jgi:hypothetical protein